MIEQLLEWDKELFLYLNSLHTPWLDGPMSVMSNTLTWLPLYAVLLYLILKEYRRRWWVIILGITFTIVLSDQITSSAMKPFFERYRPSRDPEIRHLVHVVDNYRGRPYGFASSHAANTFGVALFATLALYRRWKSVVLLFAWAAFVAYTRIYLGLHYPGDLIVGATVGLVCAFLTFKLCQFILARMKPPIEEPLA
jgi:undecaprenyl-diphosphatase